MATPNAKIQVGIALDVEEFERMKKATRVDIASQVILSLARLGLDQLEHARAKSSPSNLDS